MLELLDERGQRVTAGYRFIEDSAEEEAPLLSFQELMNKARLIAAELLRSGAKGERAVLLYPPGLDYVAAFLGCLYAGVVAVPAYPPDPSRVDRTLPRLLNIIEDSGARFILTTEAIRMMGAILEDHAPELADASWLTTDAQLGAEVPERWPDVGPRDLAFLQYTSGSTGAPKGVMLSHENLLANLEAIRQGFGLEEDGMGVIWLPPYHDMGLIGGILGGMYAGMSVVLMSPLTFLRRPLTWLEAISRFRGTVSGGPNFAYDLCCRKVSAEERDSLDLSSWRVAFSGAEPVRSESVERFLKHFGPVGFARSAFLPCYGLAEATLLVSGTAVREEPTAMSVQAQALGHMRVVDPRVQYETEAELIDGRNRVVSTTVDMSRTGMLVRAGQPMVQGELLLVRLALDEVPLEIRAEVTRCDDMEEREHLIGLRLLLGRREERQRYERALEAVLVKSSQEGGRAARLLVACGAPSLAQRVAIVQPDTLTRTWEDQVGEIWVAGPAVAAGYWGRDQESDGTFSAYLSDTGEGPYLRTGDLGFMRDGQLYVTGRMKDMIIIRGLNYYPQDIELTIERSHPWVRPGCVAAFSAEVGDLEQLVVVAEVERRHRPDRRKQGPPPEGVERRGGDRRQDAVLPAERGGPVAPEEVALAIRRAIANEHDLSPNAVVLLEPGSIPKTSSGKIQRHACQARFMADTLSVIGKSVVAPRSVEPRTRPPLPDLRALSSEERLEEILKQLLWLVEDFIGLPIGEDASESLLFQLGVDSLAAAELSYRLDDLLGVHVPLATVLQRATLRELAKEVGRRLQQGEQSTGPQEPEEEVDAEVARPSLGQEGMLFVERSHPGAAAYNEGGVFRMREPLDADAVRIAVEAVAARHSVLRTVYPGEGRAQVLPSAEGAFEAMDASGLSAEELRARLEQELRRPFDLKREPPLRVRLVASGEDTLLLVAFHHVAIDLWSTAIFALDFAAVLSGKALSDRPTRDYASFAAREARWLRSDEAGTATRYWRERLQGLQPIELPYDRAPQRQRRFEGGIARLTLSAELSKRVEVEGRSRGVSVVNVLLTAYQVLLSRLSGADDVVVGLPTMIRPDASWRSTMGYFVNPLPVRMRVTPQATFEQLLGRNRSEVLGAIQHQRLPFPSIVEACGQGARGTGRHPLFDTMFVFQRAPSGSASDLASLVVGPAGAEARVGGLHLSATGIEAALAPMDLMLMAARAGDEIILRATFARDVFEQESIEELLEQYSALLAQLLDEPLRPQGELSSLSDAQQQVALRAGNDTATEYDRGSPVHRLFERRWERSADKVAVRDGDETLTFRQLEQRANRLAHLLVARGVGPEARVGVLLPRGASVPAALLAVMKVGATYVPLDPSHPPQRLRYIMDDAAVELVVSERAPWERLGLESATLLLDEEDLSSGRDEALSLPVHMQQLAYVLYTSGSTGRPKGVGVPHLALANLLHTMMDAPALAATDVLLAVTTLSFDIAQLEIFLPLLVGAEQVIVPDEVTRDGRLLQEAITHYGATVMQATPGTWHLLLEGGDGTLPAKMFVGGEPLPAELARKLSDAGELWNMYGPTETTLYSTRERVEAGFERVTIGRPVGNTTAYVVDGALRPVARGVVGELLLGGDGLARGYLGRPGLTAERFLPDPFSDVAGARLYRTGDLVRRLRDGRLQFVGRLDNQVKVRGFRIELSEIEDRLSSIVGVRRAVVSVREDLPGGKGLAAYVVTSGEPLDAQGLRDALREALPEYMVPQAFTFLSELPLTPAGKIDRRALPAPELLLEVAQYVAPRTDAERAVAEIVAELLGVTKVGALDDFFRLGGQSLLAARLATRLSQAFDVKVAVALVFEEPTVEGMALLVEELVLDRLDEEALQEEGLAETETGGGHDS